MEIGTEIWEELQSSLSGDLNWSDLYKGLYSTDASNYQIKPLAFAAPRDAGDVLTILKFARKHQLPILPRGGGTSLVGQTVGKAIVIDFTKYLNRLLELNQDEKWARIEPGMIRDELNNSLLKHSIHFAPDPATSSRASIGGMIANNSSGTRSILYGKTIDHVIELEVMLDDGTIIQCKDLNLSELEEKLSQQNREGEVYRAVFNAVSANRDEIDQRFPKVMRRVGGYNLDEFLGDNWNLSRIFVGSEGTLGIILSAKIKLVDNPVFQSLCVVHFDSFYDSIAHIREMVAFGPASVELLDKLLIERSRENLETRRYCSFIQGNPEAAQVVEFYGNTLEEARHKAEQLASSLAQRKIGYAHPVFSDRKEINDIFTVRKKGLGLLMGVRGNRKPIAFIEDAAVPLEHLAAYIMEVFDVCKRNDTPVVAYAHASVGLLHVKPLLDLRDQQDIVRMKRISEETLNLVLKYKGSWSGEHGDGLARGPYNEKFFGKKLYQTFVTLKKEFDPMQILNPGKIINTPPQESNLRYGPEYHDFPFKSMFQYRTEGGFEEAIHLCNGVGECRKLTGGTMCPSFRVTRDEKDSTRGRANLLRLAMSRQLDSEGMQSKALMDALELCLSCKACKAECPSSVDMSKFKSEVLSAQKSSGNWSLTDKLIRHQHTLSGWSTGVAAYLINPILKNIYFRKILERIANLDARRILPLYAKKQYRPLNFSGNSTDPEVVLFADTYIRFHEPQIGYSAEKLLRSLGYKVTVINKGCCQRPAISRGLLDHARSEGLKLFESLLPFLKKGLPILVCEPSCASSLKDDLPDLFSDPSWAAFSDQIFILEDFVAQEISKGKIRTPIRLKDAEYFMHGHCHQKAIFGTSSVHKIFNYAGMNLNEWNTGCCGMAGSFGYEKKNYEVSEKLANELLVHEVNALQENQLVIANGFSCRHQIDHFTHRSALHWVEALDLEI
ncbi:MAG: FAD-binding protein [Saprospiraceae bacterium]|nr:FAD-binding protein [Saprospiraceae bacterium]HMW37844.1 FAD-linked oxidase C-terminal domain-containing protein [Saprospiraceae bacterium]HMX87530.1 FAD-linked oxidase C-terminal domain-containing protein [Saprospiraceae bacterium]HMZ39592.1 FAD-linked oxidase C-terminal domain-containing protein [Saprospiraceae bacterium]HNA63956.1 FAD-linked oxidase C-terminal domain-containing protein [Saprospiraceae bacterium]